MAGGMVILSSSHLVLKDSSPRRTELMVPSLDTLLLWLLLMNVAEGTPSVCISVTGGQPLLERMGLLFQPTLDLLPTVLIACSTRSLLWS